MAAGNKYHIKPGGNEPGWDEVDFKYGKFAKTQIGEAIPSLQFNVVLGHSPVAVLSGILERTPTESELKFFMDSGQHPGRDKMSNEVVSKTGDKTHNYHIPKAWLTKQYRGEDQYDWAAAVAAEPAEAAPAEAAPVTPEPPTRESLKLKRKAAEAKLKLLEGEATPNAEAITALKAEITELKGKEEAFVKPSPGQLKKAEAITKQSKKEAGWTGAQKTAALSGGLAFAELLYGGIKLWGPAQRRAGERVEEIEERIERGTMGDPEMAREEFTQAMAPVRKLAQQAGRQQESVMAGMGETRSAAQLGRISRQQSEALGSTIRDVASQVDARKMARADKEMKEYEMLLAYQQSNLDNMINRVSAGIGMGASQLGQIYAAEAEMEPFDVIGMAERLMEADPTLKMDEAIDAAIQLFKVRGQMMITSRQLAAAKLNPDNAARYLIGGEPR